MKPVLREWLRGLNQVHCHYVAIIIQGEYKTACQLSLNLRDFRGLSGFHWPESTGEMLLLRFPGTFYSLLIL